MPVVWSNHDNRQLFLNVAILCAADANLVLQGDTLPLPIQHFKALIDTGAMSTCITQKCAQSLKLTPIGKVPIQGVSGVQYHNNYLFYIGFTISVTPPAVSQATGGTQPVQPASVPIQQVQ